MIEKIQEILPEGAVDLGVLGIGIIIFLAAYCVAEVAVNLMLHFEWFRNIAKRVTGYEHNS